MKISIKNIILIGSCVGMSNAFGATSSEVEALFTEKEQLYNNLGMHWMDENGNYRYGDKDAASQFSLTPTMLDRMSVDQVITNMKTATQRFKAEGVTYNEAVKADLSKLKTVKDQLDTERKKIETAAETLGKVFGGKTAQDVMKMADENIKNLVSRLPQEQKTKIYDSDMLALMRERPWFNIQISSPTKFMPDLEGGETALGLGSGEKKSKSSGGGAAAAGVAAAAVSSFDIGSVVKFAGEASKYSPCGDRHYDILLDSKGYHVISKAE